MRNGCQYPAREGETEKKKNFKKRWKRDSDLFNRGLSVVPQPTKVIESKDETE